MKTVYKYVLHLGKSSSFRIEMPLQAEVLSVTFQVEQLCLWTLVDTEPTLHLERRYFRVVCSGDEISPTENLEFIGTAFTGGLGFHVFEIK